MIDILKENPEILKILLLDRTTGKNIIWATDQYESIGKAYSKDKQILPEFVHMIKTRAKKTKKLRHKGVRRMQRFLHVHGL